MAKPKPNCPKSYEKEEVSKKKRYKQLHIALLQLNGIGSIGRHARQTPTVTSMYYEKEEVARRKVFGACLAKLKLNCPKVYGKEKGA